MRRYPPVFIRDGTGPRPLSGLSVIHDVLSVKKAPHKGGPDIDREERPRQDSNLRPSA